MKKNIKEVKCIEFVCKKCETSLSLNFSTLENFVYTCPKCGEIWVSQVSLIDGLNALKRGIEIFSMQEMRVNLICDDEKDKR